MDFLKTIPFPEINAGLNMSATLLLTAGLILIRQGKKQAHKITMSGALILSTIFLISYVISKIVSQGVHTPFQGTGHWRVVYYLLLITHVVLAMVVLPLVLRTFYLAIKNQIDKHRAWARWTFPIWYYVSITGVLVYGFLFQWFQPIG